LIEISVDGSERKELSSENDVQFASISRDDRKLLYIVADPNYHHPRFMVAPYTTGGRLGPARRLEKISTFFAFGCAWTRNNRDAICSYGTHPGERPNLWRIDTEDVRSPQPLPFTEGASAPSISLAGNRLAYDRFQSDSDIWRAEVQERTGAKSEPVRLAPSTQYDAWPEYSPDGSHIAFLSMRSGALEIWTAKADGGNPRMMTSQPVYSCPRWSPDGRWIVYIANDELYRIDAGGGVPIRLPHSPAQNLDRPVYSPNGEWIYFTGIHKGGERAIWRVNANGGQAQSLGGSGAIDARESPDGSYIFYTKRRADKCALWKMRTDGTHDELTIDSDPAEEYVVCPQFTFAQGGIFYIPVLQLDEPSKVMFVDWKRNVRRVALMLGKPFRYTAEGLSVSPDGRSVLFVLYNYQGDLMLIDPFSPTSMPNLRSSPLPE
jgi:Tol biopolymer transport system component